jgi:rubrerythrin
MALADDIRREGAIDDGGSGRYACRDCGSPLEAEYERCPECNGTGIVPIEEVIAPEFTD